jgi:hypothetical protein
MKLNCTDGEPWTVEDDDLESEVEATLRQWAESDGALMGYFGWGDAASEVGRVHCDAHSAVDWECERCFEHQQDALAVEIEKWAGPASRRIARQLRTEEFAEITVADERMWFSLIEHS